MKLGGKAPAGCCSSSSHWCQRSYGRGLWGWVPTSLRPPLGVASTLPLSEVFWCDQAVLPCPRHVLRGHATQFNPNLREVKGGWFNTASMPWEPDFLQHSPSWLWEARSLLKCDRGGWTKKKVGSFESVSGSLAHSEQKRTSCLCHFGSSFGFCWTGE